MLRFVVGIVLLVVALGAAAAHAVETEPPKGTLIIIGGGLRPNNAAIWRRIVEQAGGKGARIAVFASASAYPERVGRAHVHNLNKHGAKAFFVPLAVKLKRPDYRKAADDPALAEKVRSANGAYFTGGVQGRITQALRHPDGSNTLVLDALWDLYRRGGVIAGTSAGAAIMSSTMFGNPKTVLATLKLGVADGDEITDGLGFVGDDVFIDQHLLVRGRFARMLPAMIKKGYKTGLGIDEDTAMVIGPDRDVEVIGYRGALLIDMSAASVRDGPLNVSNVMLSYLDSGDRYNLASRRFAPAADKLQGRLNDAKPYYHEPLFTADILGNTTVVDLMAKLVDSDQKQAIGLTLGSPNAVKPELGFEFKLSRTPESVGYQSPITDSYSVYNLRLDIRPIVVRRPLYQYR